MERARAETKGGKCAGCVYCAAPLERMHGRPVRAHGGAGAAQMQPLGTLGARQSLVGSWHSCSWKLRAMRRSPLGRGSGSGGAPQEPGRAFTPAEAGGSGMR